VRSVPALWLLFWAVGEGVSCWQPVEDGTLAVVGVRWGGVEWGYTCGAHCCVDTARLFFCTCLITIAALG
jgi:hypothetical protein